MKRLQTVLVLAAAAAWIAFYACITRLEWVRPRSPDPAHGYTQHLKGFQSVVYVSQTELAQKDAVTTLAVGLVIAVFVAEAFRRR